MKHGSCLPFLFSAVLFPYYHVNALGSNIVLTDDDQNVLVRYEYDVFGAIRSEVGTSSKTHRIKETRSKYLIPQ